MSSEQKTTDPYELNIDLNVLNHLGLNLYSSVPAVLSELVANAWDADATRVDISFQKSTQNEEIVAIVVHDNGTGMSDQDLRDKFLIIGYERRAKDRGDFTAGRKRLVMGRKGIGKLSMFSIANSIEIFSKHEDDAPRGIRLETDGVCKTNSW